jgi:hypothetical protein
MEQRKIHIDVNQIRLLILERKDEIKEKFKAEVMGVFRLIRKRGRKRGKRY